MGLLQPHGRHGRGDGQAAVAHNRCRDGRAKARSASSHRMSRPSAPCCTVIPGWSKGPDPESRGSGFDASHRPGMTAQSSRPSMTKSFRTLDDVDVKGKRVLLRVDLNVPMENGRV